MTNNEFTPPVPNEKLAEHYEQVETFQKARVRSVVRINKFLLAGLAVSTRISSVVTVRYARVF
ncbi:hypothetical protein [Acetobacter pasteurianus]|uniref:hypothetical protein n=1 Tax=Acetobacter pasteurianus TaxID=438 RepID=UPI00054FB02B|nr:hypothetical protein [Acetobacter pasteurianus]GCD51010.1 hypothetical protein NBRC106471_2566 [Acetobacter pasteurianus subsp. pasteurianus LMG 1262 = NBRC 106471]